MTAAATPKNFPSMNAGRVTGFERTVVIVFVSISSVTADEAVNIAMNKPVKNSVERPISRSNLMSSSRVYMVIDGLIMNSSSAEAMITA